MNKSVAQLREKADEIEQKMLAVEAEKERKKAERERRQAEKVKQAQRELMAKLIAPLLFLLSIILAGLLLLFR